MLSELYHAVSAYRTARKHFKSKEHLHKFQQAKLRKHLKWLTQHSPFYKPYADIPFEQWPITNKATLMGSFDQLNTAHLQLSDVVEVAMACEANRQFSPTINGITVGLSSGTSGTRGVFVASSQERATWAGAILAKTVDVLSFKPQKIALFLRANSNLYTTLNKAHIQFDFFDLMQPIKSQLSTLEALQPTILVAPAQVLCELARLHVNITPQKVYSVAEVLTFDDEQRLSAFFKQPIHQIYQATEGFLAATCEHGKLHLNEEFIHFEFDWLDKQKTRAIPVITDFTRKTQPIIRYTMTDVLILSKQPCPCGRHTQVVEAIEGRSDDIINAPCSDTTKDTTPIFSDPLHRVLLQALPLNVQYRLRYQWQSDVLTLEVDQALSELAAQNVVRQLQAYLVAQGVAIAKIKINIEQQPQLFNPMVKMRRIISTP